MDRPPCNEYFELIFWVTASLKSNYDFFRATNFYPRENNNGGTRNRRILKTAFERMVKDKVIVRIEEGNSTIKHCYELHPSFVPRYELNLDDHPWIRGVWTLKAKEFGGETHQALKRLDAFLKLAHRPGEFMRHYEIICGGSCGKKRRRDDEDTSAPGIRFYKRPRIETNPSEATIAVGIPSSSTHKKKKPTKSSSTAANRKQSLRSQRQAVMIVDDDSPSNPSSPESELRQPKPSRIVKPTNAPNTQEKNHNVKSSSKPVFVKKGPQPAGTKTNTPTTPPWIQQITTKLQRLFPSENVEVTLTEGSTFFTCHDCDISVGVEDEQGASETAMGHLKISSHVRIVYDRVNHTDRGGNGIGVLKGRLVATKLEEEFHGANSRGQSVASWPVQREAEVFVVENSTLLNKVEHAGDIQTRLKAAEYTLQKMNALFAKLVAKDELLRIELVKESSARKSSIEELSNLVLDIQAQTSAVGETVNGLANTASRDNSTRDSDVGVDYEKKFLDVDEKLRRYKNKARMHRQETDRTLEATEGDVKLWVETMAEATEVQNWRVTEVEKKHAKLVGVVNRLEGRIMISRKSGGIADTGARGVSQAPTPSVEEVISRQAEVEDSKVAVMSKQRAIRTKKSGAVGHELKVAVRSGQSVLPEVERRNSSVVSNSKLAQQLTTHALREVQNGAARQPSVSGRRTPVHMRYE